MIVITPETGASTAMDQELSRIERQLHEISLELEGLQTKIKQGQIGSESDATRTFSDIRRWIRLALEAEKSLAERKREDGGVAGSYALDLDRARTSIGCRLDRLRRCCRQK